MGEEATSSPEQRMANIFQAATRMKGNVFLRLAGWPEKGKCHSEG
jgi:hypothetical protein